MLPANAPIHQANYACAGCAIDTALSVVGRDTFGKHLAERLAEAVTEFLRTDPDTHLALAHIFEGDGLELLRDIQHAIGVELNKRPEDQRKEGEKP
jgi:sugar/nucleoside kinase (ribokinase family)